MWVEGGKWDVEVQSEGDGAQRMQGPAQLGRRKHENHGYRMVGGIPGGKLSIPGGRTVRAEAQNQREQGSLQGKSQ